MLAESADPTHNLRLPRIVLLLALRQQWMPDNSMIRRREVHAKGTLVANIDQENLSVAGFQPVF